MKSIKINSSILKNLDEQPLIAVIGTMDQYKSRLMNDMLSNPNLYSKKFGRIIYIG